MVTLEEKKAEIEAAMSAICIAGRNDYSRGAIQRDFADGIRELDMENAQEEVCCPHPTPVLSRLVT